VIPGQLPTREVWVDPVKAAIMPGPPG
jgi:hypothetical protein